MSSRSRETTVSGVEISSRESLDLLLQIGALHDLHEVARITNLTVVYLRRLCHARKVAHHRLLGRYYMTPAEVAVLLQPVPPK